MVEDGCLEGRVIGPAIERMYGLHGWPMLPEGVVGSRSGPLLASSDSFSIVIRGRGGHAAMPHTTIDPVSTAATIITTLQQAVSRQVDPVLGGVVSVTSVHAGEAFNVIPGECHLKGTVRRSTRRLDRPSGPPFTTFPLGSPARWDARSRSSTTMDTP